VPFSWTGFYFGGHLGAGWARKDWSDLSGCLACYSPVNELTGTHTAVGVLGGLQAGYNWQTGNWVFGFEGEYSWADLKGSHSGGQANSITYADYFDGYSVHGLSTESVNERVSTKINGIGTIAARIGVASDLGFGRTLFYVKGGGAVVRDKYSLSGSGAFSDQYITCSDGCSSPYYYSDAARWSASASSTRWGWLVGAGLEFALNANWSAKVEYDYMDFGSKDIAFAVSGSGTSTLHSYTFSDTRTVSVDQTLHVVKFGVNYRWGGGTWGW
jgi:outer membrane immunogenic protein